MATIASLGKLWRAYMDSGDQLLELFCNSDRPDLSRKVERSAQLKADRDMLHSAQVGMSASLWLTGCAQAGVPDWLRRHLRAIPGRVAAVTRLASSEEDVANAADACSAASFASVSVLALCVNAMKPRLMCAPAGADAWSEAKRVAGPFFAASFLTALSQALCSMADLAQHMELLRKRSALPDNGAPLDVCVVACARLAWCVISLVQCATPLWEHVTAHLRSRGPATASQRKLPELVTQLAAALRDSRLLAGVARAVLTYPGPQFLLLPGQRRRSLVEPSSAAAAAVFMDTPDVVKVPQQLARELTILGMAAIKLRSIGSPTAERACTALGEALGDADVSALRLAMLETLWGQAGMGEAGAEGDSGAGGSGAAAVAATEVAWEELWEHHGQVLAASLGLWQHARLDQLPVPNEARLPPEPGVPPGLQLAELEAKSAEALGRLSRGLGLGGAYPKRLLPTFESFFAVLGPGEPSLSPAEAVLALETSAWVLAMTSEGLADGGTQQERGRTPREDLLQWLGIAVKHMWLASSRVRNAWRDAADPRRADLILRLRWAGLGASLDCALRLAFTATQRADAPDPQAAKMLSDVPQHISFTCQCLRHGGLGLEALAPAEGDGREAVLGEAGGLVLTYAKRAAGLTHALESAAAAGRLDPSTYLRQPPHQNPVSILAALHAQHARLRQQGAELAAAGRAGALAVELEAYGMQAASRLAARLAADAAGLQPPHHPERDESITRALVMCVYDIEDLSGQLGDPTAPARLLACQPHRLLAAACKLLCAPRLPAAAAGAGPAGAGRGAAAREPAAPTAYSWASTWRSRLMAAVQRCAYGLAANPALSARVRRWLRVREEGCSAGAQPVLAAEAEAASGAAAEAEAEAERGCMGQAWLAAMRTARQATEGGEGALGLLLLHSARRSPAGPGGGSDAAFRQAAAALAPLVRGEVGDWLAPPEAVAAVESLARIPAAQLRNDVAAVLAAPLPLPLAVPPEGWRLTRLRVCGYPGCESFGERCESDLPLKQCGGCKGLRYCGANCQRAHWREGHSAECKALAAARRAAEAAS